MNERKKTERRDRDGEIYENDLTEESTAPAPVREEAAHHERLDPNIDSQEADEFMSERYGKPKERRDQN
ncbi:MAG TPA: hypothetical protein VMF61_15855 [Candidatus Acidoferrales bacterium]|nr:hypothetical protein [Candidatus Acidoferrales bacterium]